jgi:putative molybdopterin biosynthesis protein
MAIMHEHPELLSVKEVAELLHVSVRTVHRLIERKELPAYKVGKVVRVDRKDVLKFLQENKQE